MNAILAALMFVVAQLSTTVPGSWTTGTPMPVARSEDSVAAIGNHIFVVGGYAQGTVDSARCDVYDASSSTWSRCANLPRGLNHVGVTAYNGKLYTFGGFIAQNRDPVTDANVYDPATNSWSSIAPLPHALGSISVAVLDGKIHLVGGRDVHSVATHLVYDPSTNSYTNAAPIPVGRDHMGMVAYKNRLYAFGGRIDTPADNVKDCHRYDPSVDRWTVCAAMLSKRSGMAVAVLDNMIFAIGGEYVGGVFPNNEAYDPQHDTWHSYAPLPHGGRHGTGAAAVGDRIYLPAGAPVPGGSRQSNTLFEFTP